MGCSIIAGEILKKNVYEEKQVKCYTYIRVSTLTQTDNFSLDAQREKLHKYAEYQGMAIAGEYADEGF